MGGMRSRFVSRQRCIVHRSRFEDDLTGAIPQGGFSTVAALRGHMLSYSQKVA